MSKISNMIFDASGVRGHIPSPLDPEHLARIAARVGRARTHYTRAEESRALGRLMVDCWRIR